MKSIEKKVLSPALRAWVEKQIERLEKLAAQIPEAEEEADRLKFAYSLDCISELIEYASAYGFFESPQVKNKKEKNFYLVEPIRRQGKISLDAYGVRCLVYYRQPEQDFFISEKVFWLAELKKFVKSHCFDAEDFNECKKAFEILEGIQRGEQ